MPEIKDTSVIEGTKLAPIKDDNPWVSHSVATLKDASGNKVRVAATSDREIVELNQQAQLDRPEGDALQKEIAHAYHESNEAAGKQYKLKEQKELTNEKDRVRNLMHVVTFCKKLEKILGKTLEGTSRVFLNKPPKSPNGQFDKLNGLFIRIRGQEQYPFHEDIPPGWKKICAVQVPYMSEYGVLLEDDHGQRRGWKYIGWRSNVLLALIRQGAISEEEAHKEFGEPVGGPETALYRKSLYEFRNRISKEE